VDFSYSGLSFWLPVTVEIPKTVYVPCDPYDTTKSGTRISNEEDIADLLESEIDSGEGIVLKPDAGTHGNKIVLSKNHEQLVTNIQEIRPSITNPVGVVAQELIKKMVLRLTHNSLQRERQSTSLPPCSAGKGRIQRLPNQHLSRQPSIRRQTSIAHQTIGGEMRQSPRKETRSMGFRSGCHDKRRRK
jgi:hypothetical protein